MRQPDMSHSAAYGQDQHQLVAAYLSDPANLPTVPPTALSSPRQSTADHDGTVDFPPSELNSVHTSTSRPHPSDPWDTSYPHSSRRSYRQPQPFSQFHRASVEGIHPDIEHQAVAPVISGGVRKEARVRGSWTDHSSYMSGENHTPVVARVRKRAIEDDDAPMDASEDALLMLFRMSLPIPIFALVASLYTVFALLFAFLISPLRLLSCISYLRKTSFRAQICDLLVPQLHIHQRLIGLRQSAFRSASTQSIYQDPDRSFATDGAEGYSAGGLLMVLLLSSLMSFGLLLLAWTAAFFWIFAVMLGNPDGTERKDDGRAAVLGVARWWQIWLNKARKPVH
ncbi:hypothetical protein ARAM_006770 [Aspergillus rambellii]|uniref:Uncharacterized protein n=2 Tax=Aspergillus subgen. Nidulantes TaxID=2720870 RepID=A0A0F8UDY3_9EURO|nr:hypothetical protein AOCH_007575 [Aspergillus ochraceoroseus]KKK17939.1 hypothetical protein ARAM_006770 [Aspergillus rambellii]